MGASVFFSSLGAKMASGATEHVNFTELGEKRPEKERIEGRQ